MVYVLLDTNIILDMVVDRRNAVSDKQLKSFIKLMEHDEIRLILPEVVITETYRDVDEVIEETGKKIDTTIDAIKELNGVITLGIQPLDLTECKKNAIQELHTVQKLYQQNKSLYRKDIHNTIGRLFSHRNTIIVYDESLMAKVQKRRVHKKAPFHKESKESYGDGTITETLINIKDVGEVHENDSIIFVTGNYKDFSDPADKNKLHPDIIEDLKKVGLNKKVSYIRSFCKLISVDLKHEVENANLAEEFEAELEAEAAEEERSHYLDLEDDLRESAGLTALGGFTNQIEEGFCESEFALDTIEQFGRLNSIYNRGEELYYFFDDELDVNGFDCGDLISRFSKIVGCKNENTVENLLCVLEWLEDQKNELFIVEDRLPDYLSLDEDVEFYGANKIKYVLSIDGFEYLTPESGGSDTIIIRIYDNKKNTLATGYIDITYGYVEIDSNGGVGDGCEESVDYRTDDIVDKLKEICDEYEKIVSLKEKTVNRIKGALGL